MGAGTCNTDIHSRSATGWQASELALAAPGGKGVKDRCLGPLFVVGLRGTCVVRGALKLGVGLPRQRGFAADESREG